MLFEYTSEINDQACDALEKTEDYPLNVGTLAPLARLGAVFGTNTLHLGDRQIRSPFKSAAY